ncbi:YraN family protein [Patescibacteria group bacterium]|nr:YraN family protein [Patescibacteria group bacterium]
MNKRCVGKVAERIAVTYLKSRGYKILTTNWTCLGGELDIVAYKRKLTFIEVKSAESGFCSPCDLFNYKKKRHLLRAVNSYLLKNYESATNIPDYSFDLISIEKNRDKYNLKHYSNLDLLN